MAGDWPLVGREDERDLLGRLVRSADCRGVVLAGAAGVGKTRLAGECLAEAERAGLPTARAAATRSAAHLPFGALAPLLPPTEVTSGAAEDQAVFLQRCCSRLAERAGARRLVLLVDDAHLLDDASATLTHQLAETGSAFVLATVRSGEHAPDTVTALWKDGLAERIDVAGLSTDAIEDLLTSVLGGPLERATVARLASRCQGNVLFLRELVLGGRAAGTLAHDGGLWRLVGPLTPSDRLTELVEARLEGLTETERSLLELVTLGEPLGVAELGAADAASAEALERHGLLQSRTDGRRLHIRLAHPLYGDVLRSRTPALRLRAGNRALADAVEATGARRREDVLRVATWRLQGGGVTRPQLMLTAAQQARTRWDLPLAERLAQAAVDSGAGFDASLLLGQLLALQGRWDKAEAQFAVLARQASDDGQRAQLASIRMDNLIYGPGRNADAVRVAEEAEATIVELAARDTVSVKRSNLLLLSGHTAAALAIVEPLLPRAQGEALGFALFIAAYGMGVAGRVAEALEATDQLVAATRALTGRFTFQPPEAGYCMRVAALTYAGRLAEAESFGTATYSQMVADGMAEGQAWIGLYLANTLLARGRLRAAAQVARETAAVFKEMAYVPVVRAAWIPLAQALALGGSAGEAEAVLGDLDSLGLPNTYVWGAQLLQARAWKEVASGNLAAARVHLVDATTLAREHGEAVFESAALHDLARLGHAKEAVPRLRELAEVIEGQLAPARAAHAAALARGDADGLEATSAAFEAMGADLLAAEAAADAAVARRKAGDPRRAAAAGRRAGSLAAHCEGAMTPALQAIETRVLLTQAEREVAQLAAAGHSNKEIAAQLFLSLRTVENYLHRAYEKLGVSGRAELAAALES